MRLLVSHLSILAAAVLLLLSGCASQRGLAPGPYQGDVLLAEYDAIVLQVSAIFDDVTALADRNPAALAANADLAARVAQIRAEQDGVPQDTETLTRLLLARNAYLAARDLARGEVLRGEIAHARTVLETARALLPLFVSTSSSQP